MWSKGFCLAGVALLFCASTADACDECLRQGVNLHLPPIAPFSGETLSSAAMNPISPAYSSRPGAPATLFLDLDGLLYEDEDNMWAGATPGTVPAYDIDGDPTTFNAAELENIRQIWTRVAEAYSLFEVNVTTVDPGEFSVSRLNTRVVIGGNNAWFSTGAGGVAYVGGFPYNGATPSVEWRTAWAFPANLGAGFPKYVSDATIHEAGHQFGLAHQAAFDQDGNYTGGYRTSQDGGLTAPNLGVAYGAIRGLWSDGPRARWNSELQRYEPEQQLDLDILTSLEDATVDYPWGGYWNGFAFRPDDFGDDTGSASQMQTYNGVLTSFGVIEQSSDADMFYFFGSGGQVDILVNGAEFGQMLDIVLNLYDSAGQLIYTDNPALSTTAAEGYGLDAGFSDLLAEGDYFLGVTSNGNYGDIGQFFVTVSGAVSVPEPATAAALLALAGAALLRRTRRF